MQRYITTFLTVLLLLAVTSRATAQNYLFRVPELQMLVTVNPDASVQIAYDFTFQNTPTGHAIDVVDIGTSTADYNLGNVRASIDGRPLKDVRVSTYVKPGFEVHWDGGAIRPGRSGKLHVEFTMPNMVFRDTTRSDYASLRITPTWFGDPYVVGTTDLQIAIQLPKSVQPDEALYQNPNLKFSLKAASPQGALVGWHFPDARLTGPHDVGVSFPRRDMQRVVVMSSIDLLTKWFRESPQARITLGAVFLVLLAFLFFRFSGGTGFSVFTILSIGACILFAYSPGLHLLALPAVVVLIGVNEWLLGGRKLHYMPPIAQVEGGGIKRGLTAPEAAVLLELPVAKALSLVIFGMLKKGTLRQVQADPLAVEVDEAFQLKSDPPPTEDQRAAFCRDAAVKRGVVVHNYELPFLFLLQSNPGKPVRDINFSLPMKLLIEGAAARMKGFDLSQTKDYYRSIIRRAVEQAAAIGDIPQREQTIDRNFEWILMDDAFPTVFTYGRPYWPVWTRGSMAPMAGGSAPAAPSVPGTTTFGDVASSFSGWAENTMGSLASAISPGALNLPHPSGGFFDLSGADHVTGAFFQALSEAAASGGGGGGGGGGCACAGCACACACAGGGR